MALPYLRAIPSIALLFWMVGSEIPSATAEIYIPGDSVDGVDGDVFGWSRGDADSTFSGWDVFETVLEIDNAGAGFTDFTPDISGQFGTPGSIDVSAGTIPVGSGNAYSPIVALQFSSLVHSGTSGGNHTRVVAQFRTSGSELDYSNILLSADADAAESIAPSLMLQTDRIALGGFGGEQVDTLALWDLDFSRSNFRIDFGASASSLSLGQFTVETLTRSTPFVTPSVTTVPEPGSLALLGILAATAMVVRQRRRVGKPQLATGA